MKKRKTFQKSAPIEHLNHAAQTIEWFLSGSKYRIIDSEHYRV